MTRTAAALVALALVACTEAGTTRPPLDGDGGPPPACEAPWPATLRYEALRLGSTSSWYEEDVTSFGPMHATGPVSLSGFVDENGQPACRASWSSSRSVRDATETADITVTAQARWQRNWDGTAMVARHDSFGPVTMHTGYAYVTAH